MSKRRSALGAAFGENIVSERAAHYRLSSSPALTISVFFTIARPRTFSQPGTQASSRL